MEHPLGQTICLVTNHALENLRKLKFYQASFPITTLGDLKLVTGEKKKTVKRHKNMEDKQCTAKKPTDH